MGLFDLPELNKSEDARVVKKSKTTAKRTVVRKSNNLLSTISNIVQTVSAELGKYSNKYALLLNEKSVNAYFTKIKECGICAIDTETSSLEPITTSIAGVCLYVPGEKAVYIPLNHVSYITNQPIPENVDVNVVLRNLQECEKLGVKWLFHNANFDIRVIKNQIGVILTPYWDTHIAAHLLNENESHRLKDLHLKYCKSEDTESLTFDTLFHGVISNIVPITTFYLYAAGDAIKTYELYEFQKQYLNPEKLPGVYDVFANIEMPIVPVVVDMEENGICVDTNYLNELSVNYNKLMQEKEQRVYRTLDEYADQINDYRLKHPGDKLSTPINIKSPKQLATLLYDILKVPEGKKTKRGTGEEVLSTLDIPFAKALLEYRNVTKLVTTYIDKMPNCINPKTGKIHCRYNSVGTVTRRFSSDSPNLENIPSKNHDIRKMFVASPGNVLISSDFSKQEPLILAQFCQDKNFISAFTSGKDVYAEIGSLCFGVPYEQCLEFNPDGTTNKEGKDRRSQSKLILLGTMYGRGANSVAQQIGKTKEEAEEIIGSFYAQFPDLKKWMDDSINFAKEKGYVTTLYGSKRRLPDIQLPEYSFSYSSDTSAIDPLDFTSVGSTEVDSKVRSQYTNKLNKAFGQAEKKKLVAEALKQGIVIKDNNSKIADATRQVVNSRIQGSAANITKRAMIKLYNHPRIKEIGCKILIPVHDELICECPEQYAKECSELIPKIMIEAAHEKIDIPINCDVEVTRCWYGEEVKL